MMQNIESSCRFGDFIELFLDNILNKEQSLELF
jgi:hypothetical protein